MPQQLKSFNQFVLRSPAMPFAALNELLKETNPTNEQLLSYFQHPYIREAVFIASPDLFNELVKWEKGEHKDVKYTEQLKCSLLKYLSRMAYRCTPFGLFAGFNTGEFAANEHIELDEQSRYQAHTRFDMNYLVALAMDLAKRPEIRSQLKFYPNTSLYTSGDKVRFVEYYYKETRRIHKLSSVDNSVYLQKILAAAQNGATIAELINSIVDDEVAFEQAEPFVEEIVNSQLVVSQLEPAVTGPEFVHQILEVLSQLNDTEQICKILTDAEMVLKEIKTTPVGQSIDKYLPISEELKEIGVKFEFKYLFQTDLVKNVINCTLDKKRVTEIQRGVEFITKFNNLPTESTLSKFQEAFYTRYETREMPLLKVLDSESGLGYPANSGTGDLSPLLEGLAGASRNGSNDNNTLTMTRFSAILQKKYLAALKQGQTTIEIKDDDLKEMPAKTEQLHASFDVMAVFTHDESGKELIHFDSIGGSSAAYLLGRFCHGDQKTFDFVKEIKAREVEFFGENAVMAEIVHLPEARTGNVLLHPVFHEYEIPYLGKSCVDREHQIALDDLMLSIKNNQLVLRSKKLNKEIIPRLSNAHNYSYNALPVYHFLCDFQHQQKMGGIGFSWGALDSLYKYFPRVVYKNYLLAFASWKIEKEEIKEIIKITDDQKLLEAVRELRKSINLPNMVVLSEGDNEIVLNLENVLCIKTLLSEVKNKPFFTINEFLFNEENALVKSKEGSFTNQFVFAFRQEKGEVKNV